MSRILMIFMLLLGSLWGDASLQAGSIRLSWEAPTHDIDGSLLTSAPCHALHYGLEPSVYTTSIQVGPAISAALADLQEGLIYVFAVTAAPCADLSQTSAYSNEVSVRIAPDPAPETTPPTVRITAPLDGATVPRKSVVTISVEAQDNVAVIEVVIAVNNTVNCVAFAVPFTCDWNVPAAKGRSYTLTAVARDAAGNAAEATAVRVMAQ